MGEASINGNILWVLACGFLVMLMQAGFTCLESGLVRAKNSINVAIKNLIDFCISISLFALFGFGLMFGTSLGGWVGSPHILLGSTHDAWTLTFFFFQAVFCGTATTIVSGAVAERMRFLGYCLATVVIAGLIYPIAGHWAWAGADQGEFTGWLGKLGFIDFAGSTVVHSIGGWVALAALLVIGPRVGRFGPKGRAIEGHSLPMATLGVFLLWFGWFGFNGGSTLALTDDIPLIVANTTIAAAAGGMAAMTLTWLLYGRPQVDRIMNGVIAGLVAITASCHLMALPAALLIGAIGGGVCIAITPLLERMQIDDAIGAIPAHLGAGIWGTLAVALLAPDNSWGTGLDRWGQLAVQAEGVAAIGLFSFGVSYLLLRAINQWVPLRVSVEDERIGLNISEHGASSAMLELITQMDHQARNSDFRRPVEVEPETEAGSVAAFYNAVLEKFHLETDRRHMAMRRLNEMANYDALTGLVNRRFFFSNLKRSLAAGCKDGSGGALLYLDLDGFKQVNDNFGHEGGDQMLKLATIRMSNCVRQSDLLARLGGDEFALLVDELQDDRGLDVIPGIADKLIDALQRPFDLDGKEARIGVSIGIAFFGPDNYSNVKTLVGRADQAMYEAKLAGKGCFRIHGDAETPLRA